MESERTKPEPHSTLVVARAPSLIILLNSSISQGLASTFRALMVSSKTVNFINLAVGQKGGSGRTDATAPTVGVYGSNPNLASNGQKIDLTSKRISLKAIKI